MLFIWPGRCARILTLTTILLAGAVHAETVLIRTPLGDIEIELLETQAPLTTTNFLNYVIDDDYAESFIHRSVPEFIIQGGGFRFVEGTSQPVPSDSPIVNEFSVSNTRGTVAMAKSPGNPDSATSQWFINLSDNSENLDGQNGGFTVFARVLGNGMVVADAIAALQTWALESPFSQIPLIDFNPNEVVVEANLVFTVVSADSDEDGVYDIDDAFPGSPQESLDTDLDGVGNNQDSDDDNDLIPDEDELELGLNPLNALDAAEDLDGDGFTNLAEYLVGTDLQDPNSNIQTLVLLLRLITGGSSDDDS
jgi:cyclophilin family peptidyl-prolyl cis-trans isomerase